MMDWTGRRVLITGAAGFVGANLAEALEAAGADVHAIVRPSTDRWRLDGQSSRSTVHTADLADADAVGGIMRDLRPDAVFHAAAPSPHPSTRAARAAAVRDTMLATAALCEAMAEARARRLVYLGSSLEYGQAHVPLGETRLLEPVTFRGAAKAGATLLCRQMMQEAGIPAVVLRLFSVYGPWESGSRFVPTVMRALLSGSDLPLTRPGVHRDFVFVGDAVDACVRAAEADGVDGEIINVGSGRQSTNEELVELAQRVSGVRIRVLPGAYPARRVDTTHWVADVGKAKRLLGWAPAFSLEAGLAETWRWFGRHRDLYQPQPARDCR